MKKCSHCGAERPDADKICTHCGTPLPSEVSVMPAVEVPPVTKPKKKKKGLWIGLGVSAAVLAVVVAAGALTNGFGLITPLSGLFKAAKKTLEANSYTVDLSVTAKGDGWNNKIAVDGRAVLDWEKKDVTAFAEFDGEEYLLYEDDFYSFEGARSYKSRMPVSEVGDAVEDVYDKEEKTLDWDKLLKLSGLDDHVNGDNINGFIKTVYMECLCDDTWLEEKLGYEKNGNVYTFRPDLEETVEDLFEYACDADVFERDAEKFLKENLKNASFDIIKDFEVSFTVEKGVITKIEGMLKIDDAERATLTVELTLRDVGKTVISEEEIDDFIDRVEDAIDDDTCPDCGNRKWGDDMCLYCNRCDLCGDYTYGGSTYNYGDYETLCYDCYYDHVCQRCGAWTYTQYQYGGYDTLCADCYRVL